MDTEFAADDIEIVPAKRRQSFWNKLGGPALSFAILLHAVVLILGAIWIFQIVKIPEKKVDFMPGGGGGGGERGAETKVNSKKRAQITPSTSVKRVFAEGAVSNFSIPDPGDTFGQMSSLSSLSGGGASGGLGGSGSGKGFGSGSGSGMGSGHGSGKLFGLIPDTMGKRCSKEDRLARLKETGGTPECEEAVVKALRWLKAHQRPDGSWGSTPVAMTGLALLAFFGHCETPASEEFGDTTLRGITYLVNVGMKNGGRLTSNTGTQKFCYEHPIATYALAEATTFYKNLKDPPPGLTEVTEKAGQWIIDHQHENKGWAYGYATKAGHTDLSVVGWQIQALKACSHTGIQFKGMNNCISKGLKYVNYCQNEQLGSYGYTGPGSNHGSYWALTGVGMLCNQMWGKGSRNEVDKAARYVLKNTKLNYNGPQSNLYAHYYESQAMMQRGGEEWTKYNAIFRDQILNGQNKDGSWNVPGGGKPEGAGSVEFVKDPVYRTCLCTLMLEVYYRFLSTGNSGAGIL